MRYRILTQNRRERITGPSLGTLALHGAAFVLTLVGALGRWQGGKPERGPQKASEVHQRAYEEHLWAELTRTAGGR